MNVGFLSCGFFTDNGGKFVNIEVDKLTSKLGLSVKIGPSYSPWSNGLNEQNHTSADITFKKQVVSKSPVFKLDTQGFLTATTLQIDATIAQRSIFHLNVTLFAKMGKKLSFIKVQFFLNQGIF